MRIKDSTTYLKMGWVAVAGLITAVYFVSENHPKEAIPPTDTNRVQGKNAAFTEAAQPFQISLHGRQSRTVSKRDTNIAASDRLQQHLEVGDLSAVDAELTKLCETGQLAGVANLLKEWCRGNSIEVSQWCLAYSEENDNELNLALCAEALSNPSDVIREYAAARLETVTGNRFEDSSTARAWLNSNKVR